MSSLPRAKNAPANRKASSCSCPEKELAPAFFWAQAEPAPPPEEVADRQVWDEALQGFARTRAARVYPAAEVSARDWDDLFRDETLGEFDALTHQAMRLLGPQRKPANSRQQELSASEEEKLDFAFAQAAGELAHQMRQARAAQGLPAAPCLPDRGAVFVRARQLLGQASTQKKRNS